MGCKDLICLICGLKFNEYFISFIIRGTITEAGGRASRPIEG